jgi:hypothetical protein
MKTGAKTALQKPRCKNRVAKTALQKPHFVLELKNI